MVEQLKAVWGNTTTYATRVKGSRRVVLVMKHHGRLVKDCDGSIVELDTMRQGQTLREYMEVTLMGDILPVTGLPGHR